MLVVLALVTAETIILAAKALKVNFSRDICVYVCVFNFRYAILNLAFDWLITDHCFTTTPVIVYLGGL